MKTELETEKTLLCRLPHDSDVMESILKFANENGVMMGTFALIGAVKNAKIGYYDQSNKKYLALKLDQRLEIASCIGNISLKDGKPFVHAHVVLADERGNVKAGHLLEAKTFAAELHLQKLVGPELERTHDEVTGLSLWKSR